MFRRRVRRGVGLVVVGWASALAWGWTHRVPDLSDPQSVEGWTVTSEDDEPRTQIWIRLSELPAPVWQAFVANDDQDRARDELGPSPYALSLARSRNRMRGSPDLFREMMLTWRLDRELTDSALIELYLNVVFLGRGTYGVEAAARYWFGKHAELLDPGEAAFLATLARAPTHRSPRRFPEAARGGRSLVLDRMVERGWLDSAEARTLAAAPLPCGGPPWRMIAVPSY